MFATSKQHEVSATFYLYKKTVQYVDNILNLNKITGCCKENGEMLLRWTIFHQEIKVLKGLSHEMDLDFDDMYG